MDAIAYAAPQGMRMMTPNQTSVPRASSGPGTWAALWLLLVLLTTSCGAQAYWQQLSLAPPFTTIDDLLHPAGKPAQWQSVAGESPNPGLDLRGYWFRLEVSSALDKKLALWIRNGIYKDLDFYLVSDGAVVLYQQGAAASTRSLFHDIFLFEIPTRSVRTTIYLRATSIGLLHLPAELLSQRELVSRKEHQDFLFGMLLGVLAVLVAYFGVLYFIVRDRGFLLHALQAGAATALICLWRGFDRAPIWAQQITPYLMMMMSQLVVVFALGFALWFLRQERGDSRVVRALELWQKVAILLCVAAPAMPLTASIAGAIASTLIMAVGIGILLFRYGLFRELTVRLFALGWLIFLPATAVMMFYRLGIMPLPIELEILAFGGWVAELVLNSFALAVRYDTDQRTKLAAKAEAIAARERETTARAQALHHEQQARIALDEAERAQRDYAETLELRVQERKAELERIRRELADISITDALTGVHNRRFFGTRLDEEIARMHQLGSSLSLMLIDIDHFKRINDSHGHIAGDECLQQVAARLKAQLKRPSDVLCRYGGEEFAVLLPDTPLPGALAFAQALREAVAETAVPCADATLEVSISIGLLVVEASNDCRPERLLIRADRALYQAKQDGRNCVRVAD